MRRNFKLRNFAGSVRKLHAQVRRAEGKPPAVRAAIAAKLGMSRSSLDRYIRKRKAKRRDAFRRKGRRDKGSTRKLNVTWARFALAAFWRPPAQFRRVHREIVVRCGRRNIKAPSESWTRRSINEQIRQALAGMRIERLGDFKREKFQA